MSPMTLRHGRYGARAVMRRLMPWAMREATYSASYLHVHFGQRRELATRFVERLKQGAERACEGACRLLQLMRRQQ